MITKTIKIEARTWKLLKDRKQKKPDGNWETFAELVDRLLTQS